MLSAADFANRVEEQLSAMPLLPLTLDVLRRETREQVASVPQVVKDQQEYLALISGVVHRLTKAYEGLPAAVGGYVLFEVAEGNRIAADAATAQFFTFFRTKRLCFVGAAPKETAWKHDLAAVMAAKTVNPPAECVSVWTDVVTSFENTFNGSNATHQRNSRDKARKTVADNKAKETEAKAKEKAAAAEQLAAAEARVKAAEALAERIREEKRKADDAYRELQARTDEERRIARRAEEAEDDRRAEARRRADRDDDERRAKQRAVEADQMLQWREAIMRTVQAPPLPPTLIAPKVPVAALSAQAGAAFGAASQARTAAAAVAPPSAAGLPPLKAGVLPK